MPGFLSEESFWEEEGISVQYALAYVMRYKVCRWRLLTPCFFRRQCAAADEHTRICCRCILRVVATVLLLMLLLLMLLLLLLLMMMILTTELFLP